MSYQCKVFNLDSHNVRGAMTGMHCLAHSLVLYTLRFEFHEREKLVLSPIFTKGFFSGYILVTTTASVYTRNSKH